jgi:sulfide:quinone oxidoreductase
MPAHRIEDTRLPNGVMVRVRVPDAADLPALERLAAAADATRVGGPQDPVEAERVVVASQPWTGELVGFAAGGRIAGPRAAAGVTVAREYARTPLAAHLLVRLARLADEALLQTLSLTSLDAAEPAAAFIRDAFGLGPGEAELRTDDWQEALARVRRADIRPEPASRATAAAAGSAGRPTGRSTGGPGVLIAGGGVAALECMMALRDLAGPDLPMRLVVPGDAFVYRPLQVVEPFSRGRARRYPLADIAADFGTELVEAAVAEVRPDAHEIVTDGGVPLRYEALVLAPGARPIAALAGAITFGHEGAREALGGLLDEVRRGAARHVAFVAPSETSWTLPLYELALMTARESRSRGRFSLITPESRPLAVFGPPVSAEIGNVLASAGIDFIGSTYAEPREGALALEPGGRTLEADGVVALPRLRGPAIAGVPVDDAGFIPTDPHGRVPGLEDVYAAGDATTFPVKQGGLAAQQADAVAESVAAGLGASITPRPFKPVLRGLLHTGGDDRFLRAGIGGGEGDAAAAVTSLWWPPTKVAGVYLAPYLFERDHSDRADALPPGFTEVAVPLDR